MEWHIGTSGYYYKDWKEKFYPSGMKKENWLPYYAKFFKTVEINNTFYGTPSVKTLERWYEITPSGFQFTVKGNRFVTHVKRLNHIEESIHSFYQAITPLKEKIRCVLWQLPASLHYQKDRLINFARACSNNYVNVLEFRHTSWFQNEVMDILKKYNLTLCLISAPDNLPELTTTTSKVTYLRFHGKTDWYNYIYSLEELRHWKLQIEKTPANEAYVYFNNDYNANAITNAQQLIDITRDEKV
jgi:uncharacterized protein YecE (DUF72 family)